jgi:hypothetical protein
VACLINLVRRLQHVATIPGRSGLYGTLFQIEAQLARRLSIAKSKCLAIDVYRVSQDKHKLRRVEVHVLSPASRLSVPASSAIGEVG